MGKDHNKTTIVNSRFFATEQSCGLQLNATASSQIHHITSSAESAVCSFLVTSSPGSRVEVTITEGASSSPGCGAVSVLCKSFS